MRLIEQNIRPRDICTRKAFENAAVVVAATGGSTNGGLHLPAMAHECGIEFTLRDVAEICAAHALHRRPEARRPLRGQGHGRGRRRADAAEDPAGRRPAPRRLHDRHRQDPAREPGRRGLARRPGGDPPGRPTRCRPPAAWSACGARSPPTAPSSRWRACSTPSTAARPGCSTARRPASPPSRRATTRKATCWSSATRAPRAAPACARCCPPPPPSTARAWATRSP